MLFFSYGITRMLFSPWSTNATKKESYTVFKSQQWLFAFSNTKLFSEMLSFYKKIVTLKLAFSSRQQGPLGPPWLILNIKELSYFSTRIVHTATVFFWILDSSVYHMYFYTWWKSNTELPLSSCCFGIKMAGFTSANKLLPPHLVQSLCWLL